MFICLFYVHVCLLHLFRYGVATVIYTCIHKLKKYIYIYIYVYMSLLRTCMSLTYMQVWGGCGQ